MKFRCPYCQTIFEPQSGSLCPSCGRAMTIPPKFRHKDGTNRLKRNRLSPELLHKKRELKQAVLSGAATWSQVTRSPRYVAALVILFVVLGTVLTQQVTRQKETVVRRFNPNQRATYDLTTLRTALEMFHKDCGRYPSTRESLAALLRRPGAKGWDGPYIRTLYPDPWKNAYRYSLTQGMMRLTSDGPDGTPDTADDIATPAPDMNLISPNP